MTKFDKKQYNETYDKANYDIISFKTKKSDMLKSRLETLCISTNKTKSQLIIEAIEKLLQDNDL